MCCLSLLSLHWLGWGGGNLCVHWWYPSWCLVLEAGIHFWWDCHTYVAVLMNVGCWRLCWFFLALFSGKDHRHQCTALRCYQAGSTMVLSTVHSIHIHIVNLHSFNRGKTAKLCTYINTLCRAEGFIPIYNFVFWRWRLLLDISLFPWPTGETDLCCKHRQCDVRVPLNLPRHTVDLFHTKVPVSKL